MITSRRFSHQTPKHHNDVIRDKFSMSVARGLKKYQDI